MSLIIPIVIVCCSIAGFFLSLYIKKEKHGDAHGVCPLGQNCELLTHSRFSRFLGVPLEDIGMLYYGASTFFYLAVLFRDIPAIALWIALLVSGLSFLFSVYLTGIQMFIIRKWCTLCLGSGALSFLIMVLAFVGYDLTFVDFIYSYRDIFKWVYFAAVLLGTLVTTLHAHSFIKFLKDFTITRKEENRLFTFSHTAWVALAFVVLSGLALVLTDTWREITGGSRFPIISIVVGILLVYEIILNMVLAPRFIDIHFGDKEALDDHEHAQQRKTSLVFVALGNVTWYALLLLSTFAWYKVSSAGLFFLYLVLVIVSVVIALRTEHVIYQDSKDDLQE